MLKKFIITSLFLLTHVICKIIYYYKNITKRNILINKYYILL